MPIQDQIREFFFLDYLVIDLQPVLLHCSTNNIEETGNLLLKYEAKVQLGIPAAITITS